MNHWDFVTAAYALTLIGIVGAVAVSWSTMRRAEAREAAVLGER